MNATLTLAELSVLSTDDIAELLGCDVDLFDAESTRAYAENERRAAIVAREEPTGVFGGVA